MTDLEPDLEGLTKEVAGLRDLFQRRLLDDKAKQKLFDELYAQLEFSRKGLIEQSLQPLLREELLMLDRLERYKGPDTDFVSSVVAELREIRARRGAAEVAVTKTFDPSTQEVVGSEPGPDHLVGQVVAIRRPGYRLGDHLLRPAQVVIGEAEGFSVPLEDTTDQPITP